jgi:light-regulated signal transduction histidine kinase (bacteriophytochrome)
MGAMTLDKVPTNVRELSDSVLKELNLQITNKKIKVHTSYKGLFENIQTDPKLLRVIIQNLVTPAHFESKDVKDPFLVYSVSLTTPGRIW